MDIADTVLFLNGRPIQWYFTSAVTGEVKRKASAKLTASSIRRHCVKVTSTNNGLASEGSRHRPRARLVHEEAGQLVCSTLRDGELGPVLNLPPSDLATTSVLLQPLVPFSRQPAQARGTFVAKYNILASSACTRVLHLESGELYGLQPSSSAKADIVTTATERARRPSSAPATIQSRHFEEIIKGELRKLVHEVEISFCDRVRLLTADYQITDTHRLILVRISSLVFFSDLVQKVESPQKALFVAACASTDIRDVRQRKVSYSKDGIVECVGRAFCHCNDIVGATGLGKFQVTEMRRITRKSISLGKVESAFLKRFGAEAEATLRPVGTTETKTNCGATQEHSSVFKLLERRIFMLRNTLWNPKSDAFDPKTLEFADAQRLPHEYDMVTVCPACQLIYQAFDDHRFDRFRETAAASARRSTALFHSKVLESEHASLSISCRIASPNVEHIRTAWGTEEEDNRKVKK